MDNFYRQLRNIRVLDGDTVEGDLDLGFNCMLRKQTFRLYGVNAYETTRRGSWDNNLSEDEIKRKIAIGKEAKQKLIEMIDSSIWVFIESKVAPKKLKGKYGRWLVTLWLVDLHSKVNFNEWLLENEMGYEYL